MDYLHRLVPAKKAAAVSRPKVRDLSSDTDNFQVPLFAKSVAEPANPDGGRKKSLT